MKRTLIVGAATLALVATLRPAPVAAQATIGADLGLFSSYVWRGLSLTNKPVLQPDLWVSFPAGAASLTVGGWANIDLGQYDDPNDDISESGGTSAFNFAEFDPYAEVEFAAGPLTITPGITAYIYPNDQGITDDFNTVEIYGKVGIGVLLNPFVNVYYDVDKVKGAYVEAGVSHDIPLGAASLSLGGLVGWTGGQEVGSDKAANFANDGITHVDLSASVAFSAGAFSITPSIHGVFGQDDFTKVTSPTKLDSDFKVWGGVSIGWSKGGGEEE